MLTLNRIDLDGAGSPAALVERILELEPDLPIPVPIEDLCAQLGITAIEDLHTQGFAAGLITDEVRSSGAILVAKGRSHKRRRFSIGHELGHFLIPTHRIPAGGQLLCSAEDLHQLDLRTQDRHRRMEAEANRFAALMLMPPAALRAELRAVRDPQVTDIVRLASAFDVSKEAMARSIVEFDRRALAVIVIRNGAIVRYYRNPDRFPWLEVTPGEPVPDGSVWHDGICHPGEMTEVEECEPELWLSPTASRGVDVLTEQVLGQANGYALILLHAELIDDHDSDEMPSTDLRWRR